MSTPTLFIDAWALEVTDDHSDEDAVKHTYTATHADGRRAAIPWSPYGAAPTALDFLFFITGRLAETLAA